jgi:hypothetical protein
MAQKFIIDRDLGAFCIPYKVSIPSTIPSPGRLSLYSSLDVRNTTRVDINISDLNNIIL